MAELDEITEREHEKLNPAQAPRQEERKEISDRLAAKNQGNDLEGKTETMFSAFRKFTLGDWARAAVTSALGIGIAGVLNWATVLGSFLVAYKTLNRKNITHKGVKSEVHIANFYTPLVYGFYYNLDKVVNPFIKTAIGLGPLMFAFMPAYLAMEYLIKNYSPGKLLKSLVTGKIFTLPSEIYQNTIKPNFKHTMKDFYKYLTLPWIYVVNFVPLNLQIPALSALRYVFRLVTSRSQMKSENKQPTTAYQPAMGGAYR